MKKIIILLNIVAVFYILQITQVVAQKNGGTPNIVIIYADDMGYGDMSCQNTEAKLKTPNLDKLASEGIRFTDGHSSSGICSPSRYALLTGQYHWRRMHGIVNSFGKPVFKENEFTLPRMLKSKGYTTACIGKWHLGWNWEILSKPSGEVFQWGKMRPFYKPNELNFNDPITGGPIDQGFDYYFGDGTINFPPYAFIENDRFVVKPTVDLDFFGKEVPEGEWGCRYGPMAEGWDLYKVLPTLTEKAVAYIEKQKKGKPFLLYFALPCPHEPIIPNNEFLNKTDAGAYGDFVFQTDWVLGQVLAALKKKGMEDNTLVIFTSDNGPERLAFNRIKNTNHKSMGELRGLKRDIWEGGHRVPFIIRWPGKIEPGQISNVIISQVDLLATISAIINFKLTNNEAVDSYNFLPFLLNRNEKSPVREATIHNTYKDRYAIRKENWVLIDCFSGEHAESPEWYNEEFGYEPLDLNLPGMLFDLSKDKSQQFNVYDENQELVAELKKLLKKYREEGRSIER